MEKGAVYLLRRWSKKPGDFVITVRIARSLHWRTWIGLRLIRIGAAIATLGYREEQPNA